MEGVDEGWRPSELQSKLADEVLKLEEEIRLMNEGIAKAIHANPANQKAIHEMRGAVQMAYVKFQNLRTQQASEQKRLNAERFGV